ncbi:MAG: DUF6629 family protein [Isosphaeraceae bacterium]
MCFSAEASFVVGAALLPSGGYCLERAFRNDRRYLPLAAVPVFFAVQQFAEGFVWLDLARGAVGPGHPAVRVYLFFALAFWPFWVFLSAAAFDRQRLPWLIPIAVVGVVVGWSLFLPLVLYHDRDLRVTVAHHSIQYDFDRVPVLQVVPVSVARVAYVLTIVVPIFLCRNRLLRIAGAVVALTAILSWLAFLYAFTSVWCLFAALTSTSIVLFFRNLRASELVD